jgi:hypothetical protein
MDVILMKMAITELQIFNNIPTKVTLNEYIEISKFYSTPKSNGFINGVLDKAIDRLQKEKKIVKIGRGLMNQIMRKILFISSVLFLFSACSGSDKVEIGNKTTMVVNPVYDGGTVVKGELITAKFVVENTGKYPLSISEVKGSCTCTVAEKPNEPILPGKTGIIKAVVDTDRTATGMISKSVRIVANTEPSVTEVAIKATVKSIK